VDIPISFANSHRGIGDMHGCLSFGQSRNPFLKFKVGLTSYCQLLKFACLGNLYAIRRSFIQSHCHNILWVSAPVLHGLAHNSTQVVCHSTDAISQRDITKITQSRGRLQR
jgi:hypothetical protein